MIYLMRRNNLLVFALALILGCSPSPSVDEPVEYNGTAYEGLLEITDSSSPRNAESFDYIHCSFPEAKGFTADGFFPLQAGTSETGDRQYVFMRLVKDGSGETAEYWGRGKEFEKRIWLRYGAGNYTFYVYNTVVNSCGLGYEGEIASYGITESNPVYVFTIENTRDESGTEFYPSDVVQADHEDIAALAGEIISGVSTAEGKAGAIHKYVVQNLYYDTDSTAAETRKKQDALSVLEDGSAVCEGYTCLFMALCRSTGIMARAHIAEPGSLNGPHAWASVYVNGGWLYVDPTWDDTGYTTEGSDDYKEDHLLFTSSADHANDGAGDYIKTDW
jgi:hypothetical protein